VSSTLAAARFSSRRATFRVPGIGMLGLFTVPENRHSGVPPDCAACQRCSTPASFQ
jgi:hypothetical protein